MHNPAQFGETGRLHPWTTSDEADGGRTQTRAPRQAAVVGEINLNHDILGTFGQVCEHELGAHDHGEGLVGVGAQVR